MENAIDLIAKERSEQVLKHGRTISKDCIENCNEELRFGAIALLINDRNLFSRNWNKDICNKMVSKSYKERLVIAGALIAAEIDRINLQQ